MANTLPTTMEYFDNLLGEQLTEGGGSGGGGSSDFSTARGTLHTSIEGQSVLIDKAVIVDESEPVNPLVPLVENEWYDAATLNFVLYNGAYSLGIIPNGYNITSVSVEGGAEMVNPGTIKITGDFTLNVTLAE